MTSIDNIKSHTIRAALKATGDTYAVQVGIYEHPSHPGSNDWRLTLWMMPCGEMVFETNGDPIFESDSPDDFAALCAEYGIEEQNEEVA